MTELRNTLNRLPKADGETGGGLQFIESEGQVAGPAQLTREPGSSGQERGWPVGELNISKVVLNLDLNLRRRCSFADISDRCPTGDSGGESSGQGLNCCRSDGSKP